jgi:hypothetical protein
MLASCRYHCRFVWAASGSVRAGCVCQGRGLQALGCLRNGMSHGDADRRNSPPARGA